jgi:hypothetical protein
LQEFNYKWCVMWWFLKKGIILTEKVEQFMYVALYIEVVYTLCYECMSVPFWFYCQKRSYLVPQQWQLLSWEQNWTLVVTHWLKEKFQIGEKVHCTWMCFLWKIWSLFCFSCTFSFGTIPIRKATVTIRMWWKRGVN